MTVNSVRAHDEAIAAADVEHPHRERPPRVTTTEETRQCGETPAGVRDVVGPQPGDLELRRHGVIDGDQVAHAVTDAVHADVAGVGDDRAVRHRAHHGDRGTDLRVPGSPTGGDDGLVGATHHPLPIDQCTLGPRRTAQLVEQRGHRGRRRHGPARTPTHAVGDDEHRALVLAPGVLVVRPLPTRLAGGGPTRHRRVTGRPRPHRPPERLRQIARQRVVVAHRGVHGGVLAGVVTADDVWVPSTVVDVSIDGGASAVSPPTSNQATATITAAAMAARMILVLSLVRW